MSDQEGGEVNGTGEVELAAAFIDVRKRIAGLGDTIDSLRVQADELRRRADGRTTLTMFDPPVSADDALGMADSDSSLDSTGRHAANVADEFDPSPFDPDEDDAALDAPVGAFDNLAAAPGFEPGLEGDHASLPPVDVAPGRATLDAPEPEAILADDDGDADDGKGADVIEFAPRSSQPDDGDVSAFGLEAHGTALAAAPEHGTSSGPDVAPAFGDVSTEPSTDDAVAPSALHAKDRDDGLDAIAATGSTSVPEDWNGPGGDEAAFDKFFSNEVEPEPAQRWLLNE